MSIDRRHHLIGIFCALIGTLLFGGKAIVFKLALAAGSNVEQMMALRMGFSLPIFLIVGWWSLRGKSVRPAPKVLLTAAFLGILTYHLGTWLDFQGLRFISAQLERLILFTYPAMVGVAAWIFLGDRMTLRHAGALALSYSGIFLLFGRELSLDGHSVTIGSLLVFGAAVLMVINVIMSKSVIAALGSALFTSASMGAAAITILGQTVLNFGHGSLPPLTTEILLCGVAMAVFCTALPSFLLSEGIRRLGPGPASAIGNAGPIGTALLAVLILHEPFGWPHAAALVLTSLGVSLLGGRKSQPTSKSLDTKGNTPENVTETTKANG